MATGTLKATEAKEGLEAPVKEITLERMDLVRYAGASGDFNPVHTDEVFAKAAGQPSPFGHGMFSMGLLGTALTDWVGIGNVREFGVRFVKQTWPGETLSSRITVTAKNDDGTIALECELLNEDGEAKVAGDAIAALPTRS